MVALALVVIGAAIAVPLLTTKGQLTNSTESTTTQGMSFVSCSNFNDEHLSFDQEQHSIRHVRTRVTKARNFSRIILTRLSSFALRNISNNDDIYLYV